MQLWDCIVVGGGIAGSVVSNRLLQQDPDLKILLIEAVPNTHAVKNIEWIDMSSAIGGEYDWGFSSVPQVNLDNREIVSPVGKGLGGGTIINGDYDIWAERVGDERWSYEGQLPYMCKTETLFDNSTNPLAHGHSGPIKIQSPGSTDRVFPLRDALLNSWKELGVDADAPLIDPNFLGTAVDRYAARQTIRRNISLLTSNDTVLGREIIAGELAASPLTVDSTDEEIDARVREMAGGCYYPAGTVSMGTVVDTDLRVIGVSGLRVVDTSVFPVSVSANLQVATYALAEQAAEIIFSAMKK
ncbi:glucose dehydrogenase [Colletotrichum chrysophilum]|uniref:Glucose dehydrogenase n=1 Tax=Colletotrichum chrysophilum TaxID=1836956 RepID=A0AAD9A729_9PEZI|nr:glucose dehydrogenase [Colletotrichum chrysophilum]